MLLSDAVALCYVLLLWVDGRVCCLGLVRWTGPVVRYTCLMRHDVAAV